MPDGFGPSGEVPNAAEAAAITIPPNSILVGQAALVSTLGLRTPFPAVTSVVCAATRKTIVEGHKTVESYTMSYRPVDSPVGNLKFA